MNKIYQCFAVIFGLALIAPHASTQEKNKLSAHKLTQLKKSPIGDNTHTDVYSFLIQAFNDHEDLSPEQTVKLTSEDKVAYASAGNLKPNAVSIAEEELSHVLNALCAYDPKCVAIGLYARNDVAFALTSIDNNLLNSTLSTKTVKKVLEHPTNPVIEEASSAVVHGVEKEDMPYLLVVTQSVFRQDEAGGSCRDKQAKKDIIGYSQYVVDVRKLSDKPAEKAEEKNREQP